VLVITHFRQAPVDFLGRRTGEPVQARVGDSRWAIEGRGSRRRLKCFRNRSSNLLVVEAAIAERLQEKGVCFRFHEHLRGGTDTNR
jgi:hypothetical protein